MFPLPEGWHLASSDDRVELVSSTGKAGSIVIEEGLRPVAAVPVLIAGLQVGGLELEPAIERTVTCEGEHGALALGRAGATRYAFGFVLLDDTYVRVVGTAGDDVAATAVGQAVRGLVLSMRLYTGEPRRRRFRYRPPGGWTVAFAGSGDETWFAPDYPRHRASITVPRALPTAARLQFSLVRTLLGLTEAPTKPSEPTRLVTAHGLVGLRWQRTTAGANGVEMAIVVVALSDARYDCVVRLVAPSGTHEDQTTFARLVDSIEPVPRASVPASPSDALSFWAS